MMATRLGSLNALEQEKNNRFWKRWLQAELPSADTVGRVYSQIILDNIRSLIQHEYTRLKRNKALKPWHSFNLLILDGHEMNASYFRCCSDCLQRVIHTSNGDHIQYYHRYVIAMLSYEKFVFLLDLEEQKRGEDEIAAATRLFKRVLEKYPRAFDVVAGDALYLKSNIFKLALKHDKHAIAVLKDERRDLMQDARGLFNSEKPLVKVSNGSRKEIWDIEGFRSWDSLKQAARVVRSTETTTVKRQATGKKEEGHSDWIWVTTLPQKQASTKTIIELGHDRWLIENKGFNEMVNCWHADHVYKHHPNAILAFWLTLMFTLNLFRAFIYLNIKRAFRERYSIIHFARRVHSGLHNYAVLESPP